MVVPLRGLIGANRAPHVAVLSGKGGAGKTFVAVNLAVVIPGSLYVDCDVEEPDGTLFLKPAEEVALPVEVARPIFDADRCTGCRTCVEFCAFNALAYVCDVPMLFDEACHSCGGCMKLCPAAAVTEAGVRVGKTACGMSTDVRTLVGRMDVGVASGVPVIRALRRQEAAMNASFVVRDCPPGNGCLVTESLKGIDLAILVAEPTAFGAHDLSLVHEMVKLRNIPCGVVLNKCVEGIENPSESYCREMDIPILAAFPFERETGKLNGEGVVVARTLPGYRTRFETLYGRIAERFGRLLPDEVRV